MSCKTCIRFFAYVVVLMSLATGSANAADVNFLKIGTASMGGNFFPMGAALSEVLGPKVPNTMFTPMATGGSAYNMGAVNRDELDIALCQGTAVAAGMNGTGSFQGAKTTGVKSIGQYHATPQHVIYNAKLTVNSLTDLKGKKIEMIAPGDGIEVATQKMLEAVGVPLDTIEPMHSGNRQQASSRLKTGRVDAMIDGTGVGAAWLVDVIGDGRFKLLSLSPEEIDSISGKYGEFSKATIPAGSYKGQDEDVNTLANWTVIVVRDDLSEDVVYEITKNLFENVPAIAERHHYFKDLSLENIKGGIAAPLHPGAVKYYKEKGVL